MKVFNIRNKIIYKYYMITCHIILFHPNIFVSPDE